MIKFDDSFQQTLVMPRLKYGRPSPIWYRDVEFVTRFVRKYKLREVGAAPAGIRRKAVRATARIKAIKIPDIYGGMRGPHLHLGSGTYILNDKQWADFSKNVMEDARNKLKNAKTVNFPQLMDLSSTLETF